MLIEMKKRIKLKLSTRLVDHAIQAVLIFASVLLAFWMNENRKEKNEIEYAIEAQEAIIKEMKWNLDILERWTPYHKTLYDGSLEFIGNNIDTVTTFDPSRIMDFSKGIQREVLIDNAWNLLNQNQVRMNVQTKMLINRMYVQQNYVTNALKEIVAFLKQREILRNELAPENYKMLTMLIGELYGQETAMIRELKLTIKKLEAGK
jgi:hypothetical protein